jgi:hypothetical protein
MSFAYTAKPYTNVRKSLKNSKKKVTITLNKALVFQGPYVKRTIRIIIRERK